MADYKITFKAEGMKGGMSKQAAGTRQQAIQASKAAEKASAGAGPTSNKELINTLHQLIGSNKQLAQALKSGGGRGGGGRGGGGHGGGGVGRQDVSTGGLLTRVGGAVPVLGIPIAILGATVEIINKIGRAYAETASKQINSAGTAGFQYGYHGIYGPDKLGEGMAAYGKSTGKFGGDVTQQTKALQMSAIYGVSASETMGQKGIFDVAGADYTKSANIMAGGGIESEGQMFMSGMADILKEAISDGLDTSRMSQDLAKNLTLLTARSPHHSVEAALKMVNKFSGVQSSVAEGEISSRMGLATWQAGQKQMMDNLTGTGANQYMQEMMDTGVIDEKQAAAMKRKLKSGASYNELAQVVSPSTAQAMLQHQIRTGDKSQLEYESVVQLLGEPVSGESRAEHFNKALSGGALRSSGMDVETARSVYFSHEEKYKKQLGGEEKGAGILGGAEAGFLDSPAAMEAGLNAKKDSNLVSSTAARETAKAILGFDEAINQLGITLFKAIGGATGLTKELAIFSKFLNDKKTKKPKTAAEEAASIKQAEDSFGGG